MRQEMEGRSAVSVAKACRWMIFSPCSVISSEVAAAVSEVASEVLADSVEAVEAHSNAGIGVAIFASK